jgi:two-component system sensor histidine kinase YesM
MKSLKKLSSRVKIYYSKRSIRYTIFLSFTLTAVLAIVLAGLTFYMRFSNQLESTAQDENNQLVKQVSQSVNTYLRDMIRLSNSLYYNAIKNNDIELEPVVDDMQMIYNTYSNYVENIVLFSAQGEMLAVAPFVTMKQNVDVTQEDWFLQGLKKTEDLHFSTPSVQNLFVDTEYRYSWVISLSSAVEITRGKNTQQGVLLVDLKYSSFTELFDNMSLSNGGYIYLTNSEGAIIYHPNQQMIVSGLATEKNELVRNYKDGNYTLSSNGQKSTMIVRSVGYTGWKVVGMIPHQGLTFSRLQNILFICFIFLLFFDLLILINSFISVKLTTPLKKLEMSVEKLEQQAGESDIYIGGSYEIKHLGKSIHRMVEQLKKLTNDIVKEHEQKQKSELDALQSQINPHLLYNTLDIIVWMIEKERPDEAVRIVTALARLFRISLSKGKNIISVKDELDHVDNYLTIQTMRYKNKFSYSIEADDAAKSMSTIKLVVQPLVENSIYHSMEYMDGDGKIHISAKVADGKLYLAVKDNGLGMTQDRVDKLLSINVPVSRGSGVGLKNVHDRIRLCHGDEYGVFIESTPDVGTTVTLVQPAIAYQDCEDGKHGTS